MNYLAFEEEGVNIAHYWVVHSPYLESELFITKGSESASSAKLWLFDCEGQLSNEMVIDHPLGESAVVELGSLMQGCRLKSGLSFGHLVVESSVGGGSLCRIHNNDSASILSSPRCVTEDNAAFLPISLGEERHSMLCLVNSSEEPTALTIRLLVGKRSPEVVMSVPGRGARLLHVQSEFQEYVGDISEGQGYLRLRTKNKQSLGVQLIEGLTLNAAHGVFGGIGAGC